MEANQICVQSTHGNKKDTVFLISTPTKVISLPSAVTQAVQWMSPPAPIHLQKHPCKQQSYIVSHYLHGNKQQLFVPRSKTKAIQISGHCVRPVRPTQAKSSQTHPGGTTQPKTQRQKKAFTTNKTLSSSFFVLFKGFCYTLLYGTY